MLIPLLFMADIVGRLFREFAVTLAVTILFSAFVSLTLTPMMAARILKHHPEQEQGWFYRTSEWVFVKTIEQYGKAVRVVLRHQAITLLVAVGTLALTVYLFGIVPKGFFPVQDTGVILGISEAAETVSFENMGQLQQQLAQVILEDPAVDNLSSFIGVDGTNTSPNDGRIQITLKPLEERNASAGDVIRRLQPKLAQVAGITLYMQPVQDLTVEDRISRTQYQYSLDSPNKATLDQWIPPLVDKLKTDSGDTRCGDGSAERRSGYSAGDRQGYGGPVRYHAAECGRHALRCIRISGRYRRFSRRSNQFHVILEAMPRYQLKADALKDLYVQVGSASANLASTVALAGTNTALTGAAAQPSAPLSSVYADEVCVGSDFD